MTSQRWSGLLGAAAAFTSFTVCGVACSTPEKLGVEGSSCLLFTDCAPNLLCVPTSGTQMECLADASALVKTEESGAAIPSEGAAPPLDGTVPPSADSGVPSLDEASVPTVPDGGSPLDAGPPPNVDAAGDN